MFRFPKVKIAVFFLFAIFFHNEISAAAHSSVTLYGQFGYGYEYRKNIPNSNKIGLKWNRIAHSTTTDEDVLASAKAGINVSLVLFQTNKFEKDTASWRTFVRSSVKRYGPDGSLWSENKEVKPLPVIYYEVWNEPNINEFLVPPQGMTRIKSYYTLLKIAYEEIKAINSELKVVAMNTSGGAATTGFTPTWFSDDGSVYNWLGFINKVDSLGGYKYYDVLAVHPYTFTLSTPHTVLSPEAAGIAKTVDLLRDHLKGVGRKDASIWFSEVGFPIKYPGTTPISEQEQANFLVRLFLFSAQKKVEHIEIMYITDIVYSLDNTSRCFGLIDQKGGLRLQALGLKNMIALVSDPSNMFEDTLDLGKGNHGFIFRDGINKKRVVALWTESDSDSVEINMGDSGAVKLLNMYGKEIALSKSHGVVHVAINESPCYLVYYYLTSGAPEGAQRHSVLPQSGDRKCFLLSPVRGAGSDYFSGDVYTIRGTRIKNRAIRQGVHAGTQLLIVHR
jgi:hypothetical protein